MPVSLITETEKLHLLFKAMDASCQWISTWVLFCQASKESKRTQGSEELSPLALVLHTAIGMEKTQQETSNVLRNGIHPSLMHSSITIHASQAILEPSLLPKFYIAPTATNSMLLSIRDTYRNYIWVQLS